MGTVSNLGFNLSTFLKTADKNDPGQLNKYVSKILKEIDEINTTQLKEEHCNFS